MRQSAALPDATIWREASLAWFHFTTCIPSLISKSFFIFSIKPLIIHSFALANSESIGTPLFQVSRTALLVAPSKRYDQGNLFMKRCLCLGTPTPHSNSPSLAAHHPHTGHKHSSAVLSRPRCHFFTVLPSFSSDSPFESLGSE
jgi:hypothetical protein